MSGPNCPLRTARIEAEKRGTLEKIERSFPWPEPPTGKEPWNVGRHPLLWTPTEGADLTRAYFPLWKPRRKWMTKDNRDALKLAAVLAALLILVLAAMGWSVRP